MEARKRPGGRVRALLLTSYLAELALFVAASRAPWFSVASGDLRVHLLWGALWLPHLAFAAAVHRSRLHLSPRLLAAAVLPFFAAALLATPPAHEVANGDGRTRTFRGWLSDDYHRFLFDGELLSRGENPYHVVPRDRGARDLNHPDLPTFYSPLAEAWFCLVALSGAGWRGIAIGNALAVAASVLLLGALLRRRGAGPAALVLFAGNPLLLAESALGLHFDPLVMLALLALLFCLETGRRTAAAAAFVAAVGLKLFPVLLLPVLLRPLGGRRTAAAAAALLLLHLPLANGETLSVYRAFAAMSHHPSPLALLLPAAVRGGLLLAVVLAVALRPGPRGAFLYRPLLALLLLSPTVHPWYLLWLLPFAVLDLRERWPVLLATGLFFLSYSIVMEFFRTGAWAPAPPRSTALWIALLAAFSVVAHRRLSGRRGAVLLLAWPIVALLVLGYRFEIAHFTAEWAASFPTLAPHFGRELLAPYALRPGAILPVRLLAAATGANPVLAGTLLLAAGHVAALSLLARLVPRRGLLLYLLAPYFWLLPWGQIGGALGGPPRPAWHFGLYAEGIYLPLAFLTVLWIRRGARARVVLPLLALLLATKESAFLFTAGFWVLRSRFSLHAVLPAASLGLAYVAALLLSGRGYPSGVPVLLPAFAGRHLAANGWGVLAAAAWALVLGLHLAGRLSREDATAVLLYGAALLLFSMGWETRLWLVAAPCLLNARGGDERW